MIFKKEKWLQSITPELMEILTRVCDGAIDSPFLWWNELDGVKVYPSKEFAGYYTDKAEIYLFMKEWCEEEEDADSKDRTENR